MKPKKNFSVLIICSIFFLFFLEGCDERKYNQRVAETNIDENTNEGLKEDTAFKYVLKFKGTLPCADCPGIKTELIFINDNLTYKETNNYLERNVTQKLSGSYNTERGYKKDEDATLYVLDDDKPGHERYFLRWNDSAILMLDNKQEIIDTTSSYQLFEMKL